ncbi:uncharacterized protein [Montipora foliosa]|uniref:uncharacterized protein n=1 Tax=Montipora foliosa TaxID=591990 RepID=UPI0035F1A023
MRQVFLLVGVALSVAADKLAETHFKADLTRGDFNPCTSGNYQTINSSDRLVGNTDQSSLKCDRYDLIPGWYRFTGDAGDKIPNTRPPHTRRCGTHAPGWMKGSNPVVADGEVTRTVCYFWSGNPCRWRNSIKVKNCGAFYVYELQKPPACWLRYCGEASECSHYTTLDQADRAVGNTDQRNLKCDRWGADQIVSHDWYRMTGDSGDQIPEQCVPINRCGTHAPGWLNDTHPTVQDGLQSAQVCYHWNNNCCKWKSNIKIRNCSSYFVYQLVKPPACHLRYCGNRNALSTTPPPITRPALDPCTSGIYRTINSSDRLVGNTDQSSLKCDRYDLIPGWYRFTGDAGDKIPNTRPPHTRRCGTHAPGWIKGSNPVVADGEVTRTVCYFWSGHPCRWRNSIKVKNCGAFYVYELQKPPACWLRYCGEASECSHYTTLDQADRAVGNTDQRNLKCDRRGADQIVSHDWYRMTGDSGDQIPEQCVAINRCGTHAPGWLNDTHPTVQDGLQSAQVCYHWNNNCCKWKSNIKIRNCSSYFVYQLVKPPTCYLRYCGNRNALSTTPPPITRPALDPCTSGIYRTINSSDRLVGNTDQSSLKCDRYDLIPGWYRFTGDAGDKIPNTRPPHTRRCGTHAPGWIKGSNPVVADGEVTRTVCYFWSGHPCRWRNSIKVKNCGAFYVYELQKPPACWLRYCGEASECSHYTTLDQADRAVGNTDQRNLKCDRRGADQIVSHDWYRMTGDSGDQIPEQCVAINRCGTHAPGWLNDTHPTVQDGLQSAQVCYHWNNNCCKWKSNIKIRNCSSYFVYQLVKPPTCYLRYCGNRNALSTTPPPITRPALDPCTSGIYRTINSSDRLVGNTDQSSLKCDRYDLIPGWYRFTGDAGDKIPNTRPPHTRRCGTHAPGWIKGSNPVVADGEVTRTVCYFWSGHPCRWRNSIKVKNCGAFYVYELQKPPACWLRYCGEASECSHYTTLDQADRAVGNTDQRNLKCDRRGADQIVSHDWYRMTGDSGDQIPEQCVAINRCGTHAPGWLNDTHPTVQDGLQSAQVCYHWNNNCCKWKSNIKIRNCSSYFVYQLVKPPTCYLRYCGNRNALSTTPPPITRPALDPCTSGIYRTINSSDRLVGNTDQSSLKCDRYDLIPGWYRFTGDAGDKIPNTRPPHTRRCGTHAPGWIKGSNPVVADGEVTRTVCYFWSGHPCRWRNSIKVKNCGAFYVYELQKPPACWLRYCGEASECSHYTTLDQADRAVGNTDQRNLKCDRRGADQIVSHDWYRMTGDSGDQIPEQCVAINRCGTHAPGWLNDTHPTVQDGLQSAQVCYHWNNNCCKWKSNIKIRNCSSYFVYQLVKPPTCYLRYCGNRNALSTTPPPITRPALDPCTSGIYRTINSSDRLVGNTDQSSLKCDRYDLIPGWYRFTGDAGDKIPNTRPPHTRRCGTHAPGWIKGSNPVVADGEVTRTVCYFWSGHPCRWRNSIKVKNCGAFYVYELQKPPACWLRYCGEASECSHYTTLDQADRAVGNTDQRNLKCDRRGADQIVSHDWYRMTGDSGDQIPEQCVAINRCGTHAPGWLNDTHPTVQDGLQSAQVCYHWNNNCCKWKSNIKIRNCSSYFVYQLVKPPTCYLRYCGNRNALSTTPPPITRPALDPCTSGIYRTINSSDRLVGNTDQSSLKCDRYDLIPGWYRFTGDAGDKIPNTRPPHTRRCGTHAPGWIKGSNPVVADGEVTRTVCYFWSGHPCRWRNSIKVKNCGAFYVYELQKPPACWLRYCGEASECSHYTTLDQADRAVGNTDQRNLKCDRRGADQIVSHDWYRMTGDSGDQIPEQCVAINRCGTHAPGWLNDTHPTVQDGLQSAQVCYHWNNNCCKWKSNIKIRNCSSYFVYQLVKPPTCYLRYCGNRNALSTTPPPITRPALDPCTSGIYRTINSSDRLVGNTDQSSLKCDRYDLIPGWYRFTGDAGDKIPNTRPPHTRRCGTHAPGWIKGSNPVVADGEVTRTVCYFWSGHPCRWRNSIKVKNCGAFYVYELQKPPACWLRYCGEASECSHYTTLDQADRAVGNTDQRNLKCDRRGADQIVSHDWYRMTGDSGDQIPEQCVAINRCGTHAPGWLNDTHPTVQDGLQSAQVCYHWNNNCCKWKSNIKIRNCSSYFVYQLVKPPTCYLRYCGNRNALSTTPPPITRPALDPCTSGIYRTINSSDRLVGNTDQSSLKCDRYDLIPGWYRFTGDAGDKIPNTRPPHTRRCGTHAPGWIKGSNPVVADGEVTRTVCYFWSGHPCRWRNSIKVKNCGAFYVYELQKPPACWLRYCGEASECSHYTTLDQADRAVGNTDQRNLKCDRRGADQIVSHDWYRMTGDSGDQIPEQCVAINRCGTHAPGWLNDTHPTVQDGLQSAQVCYHWNNNCCKWKSNIKIRNCSSYFVYQLVKPPTCYLRYCGNRNALSTTPPPITRPVSTPPTAHPPGPQEVNVTCRKNEMWINLPKSLLRGVDRKHLRLLDANCSAQETRTHFILYTKLTECQTVIKHTSSFVSYMNKVLEIPLTQNQTITRVREVEIPFTCYYSNTGVVSAVGIKAQSKKVLFSKKGFGKFVLEMNIYPDGKYVGFYKKKDFPLIVPLRKILFVQVRVDSEDRRLAILAEECFATPDVNPYSSVLKYTFIANGCAVDDTVNFIESGNKQLQRYSIEAFQFLGDHEFVYLHCKVKICNATDPYSRCAQGCIPHRRRRVARLPRQSKDEEATLAEGPFMRQHNEKNSPLLQEYKEARAIDKTDADASISLSTIAMALVLAVSVLLLSYFIYAKKKHSFKRDYHPLAVPVE